VEKVVIKDGTIPNNEGKQSNDDDDDIIIEKRENP
jgi:hypothetical protein